MKTSIESGGIPAIFYIFLYHNTQAWFQEFHPSEISG
jgi:hypothetical protein